MKWNTELYDAKHGFVSKFGESLIDLLAPQQDEMLLDIGCGTGDLTHKIALTGAKVTGIDTSPEMISTAKNKYPALDFSLANATSFQFPMQFDAIFSNATLHWVLEYEKVISCVHKALKKGGRFVAELGGEGNVYNIIHALKQQLHKKGYQHIADKNVWYFPSLSAYASLLEKNGFRVVFATHFNRETPLLNEDGIKNWLKMFGQPYLEGIPAADIEAIIHAVENQVKPTNYKEGNWFADYVRLRIVAIKK
jgi:trans-aconitate methyltransferase